MVHSLLEKVKSPPCPTFSRTRPGGGDIYIVRLNVDRCIMYTHNMSNTLVEDST